MAFILDDGESLTISTKPLRMLNGICEVENGAAHTELSDEALLILTGYASIAFGVCLPIHSRVGDDGKMRTTIGDTIDNGPVARRPIVNVELGPVWPPVGEQQ